MFSWTEPRTQPIIVAHRGLSMAAPENTLAAFGLAIEAGADAVELDVRCTADGRVVVIHDATLDRTTNGHGRIRSSDYSDIRKFSAGSWFGRSFSAERVPLLSDVLALIDNRIGVNIEIKEPPRRSRYDIVALCIEIIRAHRSQRSTLISSFHHHYIKQSRQLEPRIATAVLHHPVKHFRLNPAKLTLAASAEYFICAKSALRKRIVRNLHEHSLRAGVYTVNQSKTLRRVARAGVDMIFTDDPARIRMELKEFGEEAR